MLPGLKRGLPRGKRSKRHGPQNWRHGTFLNTDKRPQGGSDVFFGVENLHARYFFGSRNLSRIFLGLKKIRVFLWVLSLSELVVSGFRCDQWIRKIFIRTFFSDVCSGKTVSIKKTIQCTFVILFTFPVFSMTHYNDVNHCLSCPSRC